MKETKREGGSGRVLLRVCIVAGIVAGLSGCGLFGKKADGGAAAAPAAATPTARFGAADPTDPVPRNEPPHPTANRWYGANGKLFRPFTDDREFKERGKASIIPSDQEGQATASGEAFTTRGLTAAHSRLPIPSYARVTNLRSGKTTIVRVNDRGAYDRDEAIAVSAAAAQKIALAAGDEVEVERITPAEIAAMPATRAAAAPAAAPAPAPTPSPPPAAVATLQAAPAPAEPTPLPPQPVAVEPAPAPMAAPTPAPVATTPAPAPRPPTAPAPAPRAPTAAPAAAAIAPAAVTPAAAAPRAARAAAAPSAPTGRWSVQVAAFATDSLAESTRARVAQQLASNGLIGEADRTPRVERRGNRSFVLLGDFADRDAAEALAGRLRAALRQDVVVDRF